MIIKTSELIKGFLRRVQDCLRATRTGRISRQVTLGSMTTNDSEAMLKHHDGVIWVYNGTLCMTLSHASSRAATISLGSGPFELVSDTVCQYYTTSKEKQGCPRVDQCRFQLVCLAPTIDNPPVGFQHLTVMHQPSSGNFIEREPQLVLVDVEDRTVSQKSNNIR